jgi:hypothetical protein
MAFWRGNTGGNTKYGTRTKYGIRNTGQYGIRDNTEYGTDGTDPIVLAARLSSAPEGEVRGGLIGTSETRALPSLAPSCVRGYGAQFGTAEAAP